MNKLNKFGFKLSSSSLVQQIRQYQIDIFIVIGLAIAIAISTALGTQQIPTPIFTDFYAQDVWFGSDIPTVFGNITSFDSDFGRNNKHPLFPLIVFPLVFGTKLLLGLSTLEAVRLVIIVVAMLWIGSLYILFRAMGCQRLDATLLGILGGISAASMFWLVTPESFPLGSVTILIGLIFVVLTQIYQLPLIWYVAINVITVSITITNAMVGIFATLINQRWWRIIQIGAIALFVSTSLWIVQRILFINTGFPFQPGTFIGEKKFISAPEHNNVLAAISSFFYQTMVMPATQALNSPIRPDWVKLDADTLNPTSGSWLGGIAIFAWTGLLLLGIWSFFSIKQHVKLRIVLGLTLIAQILLHSIYGVEETFIYTLHFAPLLLTLVAFSLFTRLRLVSLSLVVILIVSAGVTNRLQFNQITATLWNYGTPHQQLEAQMQIRPSDPWMRSEGHVVLAATGSSEEGKAFHEPGGSFSPQPGSFGVSIWVIDSQGNLQATSDNIPLKEIQQQFAEKAGAKIPKITNKTPYYEASWSTSKLGSWQLNLTTLKTNIRPTVVIRSVGPAGGAIDSLNWNGQRLLINNRWIIKNLPSQVKVYLGSERSPNWVHQKSTATEWQDEHGWGYARFELDSAQQWNIEVEDLKPIAAPSLAIADVKTEPELNLPNAQFVDSFKAQIAHLKMGLVGNQTRPGDPLEYPLPRFRDGAYELVALARTGHLELAKQLLPYFAVTDFLDGTQQSADIPALGIWVLTTVAAQVSQPEYDQSLWTDVYRKAELIVDLIASNRPGYPVTTASRKPFSEHSDFARVELTAGKMDATPGLIALDPAANFMSYRALLDAANFATRLNQTEIAEQWRSLASQMQSAWQETFDIRFAEMDTTYTTGLWPSGIAAANQDAFVQALDKHWQDTHDDAGNLEQLPENTNVNLAEAHQWLYLNQGDRVWSTLKWFWEHQSSPGLYTWWGSNGNHLPTSLSQWQRVRGWVNPPHITPYYFTTAEMALLQLEMLAYVNPTANTPTVVIGAGIPQEWLKQSMSVKGLSVGGTVVDWEWDGKQMNIQFQGKEMDIQLGNTFPANTPVNIELKSSSI